MIIRIELIREIDNRGRFEWLCHEYGLAGESASPLISACRELEKLGADRQRTVGLFRAGKDSPDLYCNLGGGADLANKVKPTATK